MSDDTERILNPGKFTSAEPFKETAIGIRADEQHRIDRRRAYEEGRVYPLVDMMRVNSGFIRRFLEKQDFDLGLKDYEGNCDMCWKKSDRKLMTLYLENPERLAWWADMEKKYGGGEFTFFRDHKSAENIAANSKMPFDRVTDEHEASKKQFDFVLDQEEACTCKSTTIAGGITPLAQTPEQRTGA